MFSTRVYLSVFTISKSIYFCELTYFYAGHENISANKKIHHKASVCEIGK